MSRPYICAVVGKGFGDEGKGMAVDFLSSQHENVLVIRHNGGAQSGHTVDLPDKRVVFHELSSGSFRHAVTFWADTYFPDLYKLGEELSAFYHVAGFIPQIISDYNTSITIIDDVLLNMAIEKKRGSDRHGSCGMGIYEAQCRNESGFGIKIGEIINITKDELVERLKEIRDKYLPVRLKELGLRRKDLGEYDEMLKSTDVLANVAEEILTNIKYINVIHDIKKFVNDFDCIIFENGQGLLLDSENAEYSPHVTASRTGLTNPCNFLKQIGAEMDEVVYVSRSYVTRHGAGPLPHECKANELGIAEADKTNLENEWQGKLRYAPHVSLQEFVKDVKMDLLHFQRSSMRLPLCSLLITHLNETAGCLLFYRQDISVKKFCENPTIKNLFDKIYISSTYFSKDIKFFEE